MAEMTDQLNPCKIFDRSPLSWIERTMAMDKHMGNHGLSLIGRLSYTVKDEVAFVFSDTKVLDNPVIRTCVIIPVTRGDVDILRKCIRANELDATAESIYSVGFRAVNEFSTRKCVEATKDYRKSEQDDNA
jgi:hypothetical protein